MLGGHDEDERPDARPRSLEHAARQVSNASEGSALLEATVVPEPSGASAEAAASVPADETSAPQQLPTQSACDDGVQASQSSQGPEAEALPLRAPQWLEACDGSGLRPGGQDFYELLGVEHDIGPEELRRSYREQARRLHPDKAGPEATEQFQLLSQAYGTLSDEHLRSMYDLLLERFRPLRPTAAELCPGITSTGTPVVDPFRASPSELKAVATFDHEGLLQVPADLHDISWHRCSHDFERVRLTFCGCYAALSDQDFSSLRLKVYDSVMLHLAALLVASGWRSESGEETKEDHDHPSELVARHCVLGSADASSYYRGPLIIRFALEGRPRDLRSFLQTSHEQTLRRTGQDCTIS